MNPFSWKIGRNEETNLTVWLAHTRKNETNYSVIGKEHNSLKISIEFGYLLFYFFKNFFL